MPLKIKALLLLAFLCNLASLNAQVKFGPIVGATVGKISGLESTIISEPYFIDYSLTQTKKIGWQLGAFVQWDHPDQPFSFYGEASFLKQGTNLHFLNEQTNFSYDMTFAYEYANILAMMRIHPFITDRNDDYVGLYLGIGPHIGIVTSDRIQYRSQNGLPEFGQDSFQEQQLKLVLKGRTDFGVTADVGYKFGRFDFGLRGHVSFTDVVEAQPNSYNFIDNNNKSIFLQAILKYDLSSLGR